MSNPQAIPIQRMLKIMLGGNPISGELKTQNPIKDAATIAKPSIILLRMGTCRNNNGGWKVKIINARSTAHEKKTLLEIKAAMASPIIPETNP